MATSRSTSPHLKANETSNQSTLKGDTHNAPAGGVQFQQQPTLPKITTTIANTHPQTDSDSDSTATNSSDEFNWDAEDDGISIRKGISNEKKAKRGRRLWLLFIKLARPIRIFLAAVLGGGILVTPALVFMLRFPNSPARWHVEAWSLWFATSWVVCCALSIIVEVLPQFLLWIIFTFYGKPAESLKTQMELFLSAAGWLKIAMYTTTFWVSLSLVRSIVKPPGTYWPTINEIMQALFAASVIFLAQKMFVKIVAIRFHQKALADRLQENRIALKALDKLSNATPQVYSKKKKGHSTSGSTDALNSVYNDSKNPSPSQSGRATPNAELKVKGGAVHKDYEFQSHTPPKAEAEKINTAQNVRRKRKSKAVTAVLVDQLVDLKDTIGQVALKDSKLNREGEIGSLYSARRLAKQLFTNLASSYPRRNALVVEDFYPYFRTEADAITAFRIFDKDGNGDISKKEMREAVQRIYRERKALTASLKDMSSAVSKLDAVMMGVALIIIIFICLLIFNGSGDVSSLVPLATIVLGFSFVFGNSAKTLFESLIFIFSTHVYDVGDLVIIDDLVLFVKEFGLFATTFRRVDGQEVVAPNSLLATAKLIHNVRRSGSMWETTELNIAYSTPLEVVEQLKARLRAFMAENSREWGSPGVEIWIDKMKFQTQINLTIAIEHRKNWQEWGARWARRNEFMKCLKGALEELEITYQLPVQPITFHPSSMPPPWMAQERGRMPHRGDSFPQGPTLDLGNVGYLPRDPIRSAPSGPQLTLDRF